MLNGILLINKPSGMTSHDVVDSVRKTVRQKKVGHAGTLDKQAVGLLVILLGKATKLSEFITGENKAYSAQITLGISTDSDDSSGSIISKKPCVVSKEQVLESLKKFRGKIRQSPPRLSAIHISGQRLYKLTKKGIEVDLPLREVEIFSIELTDFQEGDLPENQPDIVLAGIVQVGFPRFDLRIKCSKGTYIRSLARDIGDELGCGGHISYLRRDSSGKFMLKDAVDLDKLQSMKFEDIEKILIPLKNAIGFLPKFTLKKDRGNAIINGQKLKPEMFESVAAVRSGRNVVISSFSDELLAIMQSTDDIDAEKAKKLDTLPLKYVKVIA
jgi:tRNA pseudouridine55 synthase